MPEATSAGGGYSCQVCGTTYATENDLIQHGRDQHPDKPVAWGDPREVANTTTTTVSREEEKATTSEVKRGTTTAKQGMEETMDKMKAGAKAVGEKMSHPDKDLGTEYERKKAEERSK